jgi:hypothetical protein
MLCDFGWLSNFEPSQWESDRKAFAAYPNAMSIERKMKKAISAIESDQFLQNRLAFLEQLVVTDVIAIDQVALHVDLITLPAGLENCFQQFRPSEETYREAEEKVKEILNEFKTSSYELDGAFSLTNKISDDPFWSESEKRYHHLLFRQSTASRQSTARPFVETDDTLARALFYLEFGRQLDITPNLSSEKKLWLDKLQQIVTPPVHARITKLFDDKLTENLKSILNEAASARAIATPPVAELIVRTCLMQNRSLDEVTIELKESKEAKSYREMLATIEGNLKRGRLGIIEAAKEMKALSNLAELWGKELDPSLGVFREKRTLKFKSLPLIGKLLETASMSEMEIKDYILDSPPGYLAFISSWYTHRL